MIRLVAVIEIEGQAPRALQHESNNRVLTIGRDAAADFQVPLSTISRQHARICLNDDVYTVEDLGSTHGTVLNGRKLGKGEKKVLRNGDVLELTRAKITCTIESERVASADTGEGTQAIAAKAVQGILGRLGDATTDGPYLRVLNGPDEGVRFSFAGSLSEWAIGRSKECEFILNDPNVSRRHAQIKRDWNGFTVHDLGSKNGVLINDKLVRKPRRLHDRDEITVGPIKLVYVDPNAELMAALKDVPGFDMEDPPEPEEHEGEPSHLGAPNADGGEQSAGGEALPEAEPEPSAVAAPAAMPEEDYDAIDPALLAEPKGATPVEWIIVGVVAFVLIVAVLLLVVLLPTGPA